MPPGRRQPRSTFFKAGHLVHPQVLTDPRCPRTRNATSTRHGTNLSIEDQHLTLTNVRLGSAKSRTQPFSRLGVTTIPSACRTRAARPGSDRTIDPPVRPTWKNDPLNKTVPNGCLRTHCRCQNFGKQCTHLPTFEFYHKAEIANEKTHWGGLA